jgi:hypothetical protein
MWATTKHTPISDLFGARRDETTNVIGIQIVLRQCFWSPQTNGAGISGGQSAAVRRGACILHGLFARAADSCSARGRRSNFPKRSSRCLGEDHATDELFPTSVFSITRRSCYNTHVFERRPSGFRSPGRTFALLNAYARCFLAFECRFAAC